MTAAQALRIPGIEEFGGRTLYRWTPPELVRGLRVGVIGDGSSLAVLVPALTSSAADVKVFQRAPGWLLPEWAALMPSGVSRALCRLTLRRRVRDPWLRRQLTPAGPPSRTPVATSAYYRALQESNCKLITWPIATIVPAGIRTCDGIEHHLDAIVFSG